MNRRVMAGLLAFSLTTSSAVAKPTPPAFKDVPCHIFAASARCVDPIVEGVVDGQWIGLLYHYNGTNGGADMLSVVTIGLGGNGLETMMLPSIKPDGDEADRMVAVFRRGKLMVINAIYLPGEAHCCFTHETIRRFGFHRGHLLVEREATVVSPATAADEDAELEKQTHFNPR